MTFWGIECKTAELAAEPAPADMQLSKSALPEGDHGEHVFNPRQAEKATIVYYLYRPSSSIPNTSNAPEIHLGSVSTKL